MKIWRLSDPHDYSYARVSLRGTWSDDHPSVRIGPIVIEWEPGSDEIGDFLWPGFGGDLVAKRNVANALSERFGGLQLGPVEMVQEEQEISDQKCVRLPYRGPPLADVWVETWGHADLQASTLREVQQDEGQVYELEGAERWEVAWDSAAGELRRTHIPRIDGAGIFIAESRLNGASLFKCYEVPGWILCTSSAKSFIELQGYSNAGFLEVGDTA